MKRLIIIIFLIQSALCKSQIINISDKILTNFTGQINTDWNFEIKKDTLKIESKESMFIEFYNSAGVPVDDPNYKKYTDEYLQKNGLNTKAILFFKLENKWSPEKIKETIDSNAIIYKEIDGLLSKYQLTNVKRSFRYDEELFWGATKEEEERIKVYKQEKEELNKRIIELPQYKSEKYSLFIVSRTWVFDEHRAYYMIPMIYPKSEKENIQILEKQIENILGNKN